MLKHYWKGIASYTILAAVWIVWGLSKGPLHAVAPYLPLTVPAAVTLLHWLGVTSPPMPPMLGMLRMLRKGPSVVPAVLVLGVLSIYALACPPMTAVDGGAPGSPTSPTAGDPGVCVLETVSHDVSVGIALPAAIADAALKCFGSASAEPQVRSIWGAHIAASELLSTSGAASGAASGVAPDAGSGGRALKDAGGQ